MNKTLWYVSRILKQQAQHDAIIAENGTAEQRA